MKANKEELTIEIEVPVEAKLVLEYIRPGHGTLRDPVTREHLSKMRFHHEDDMYDRTCAMIKKIGLDPSDGIGSQLRYFIEHATHYIDVHSLHDSDFTEGFEELIQALGGGGQVE